MVAHHVQNHQVTFLSKIVRALVPSLLAAAVLVVLAAAMPWLSGRDPAKAILRARFEDRVMTPEALAAIREQLNLPANPFVGAWSWVVHACRGDLGTSWVSRTPVVDTLPQAYWVSLELATLAAAVAMFLALTTTVAVAWAYTRSREGFIQSVDLALSLAAALPGLVVAIGAIWWFGVSWKMFPLTGWGAPEQKVMPTLALALPSAGVLGVLCAQAVATAVEEEWVTTWRVNGVRRFVLVAALVQRSLTVVVPYVFLLIAGILGAAVVVEELFAIPGMGRIALRAALSQDVPVVQASLVMLVLTGTVLGAVGRLLSSWLMRPLADVDDGSHSGEAQAVSLRQRPVWCGFAALSLVFVAIGWFRSAEINISDRKLGPSGTYPLGTDHLGRDVWARLSDGALLTIGVGVLISVVVLVLGLILGMTKFAQPLADVLNAVPEVFLGLVLAAVVGAGWLPAVVAICLVAWIPLAVHTRVLAEQVASSGFVATARVNGASRWWILRHHMVPMVLPAIVRHAAVRLPHVSLMIASLSFIGLGAGHGSPEWGKSIADAMPHLTATPWSVLAPVGALVVLGGLAVPSTISRRAKV